MSCINDYSPISQVILKTENYKQENVINANRKWFTIESKPPEDVNISRNISYQIQLEHKKIQNAKSDA